jgi:hypothetical protein
MLKTRLTFNYSRKGDLGVFFEELDVELLKPAQHVNDHGLRRQDCGPASARSRYKIDTKFAWSDIFLQTTEIVHAIQIV